MGAITADRRRVKTAARTKARHAKKREWLARKTEKLSERIGELKDQVERRDSIIKKLSAELEEKGAAQLPPVPTAAVEEQKVEA